MSIDPAQYQSLLEGKSVLTVDDSSTVRAYLKATLENVGAAVDCAESGRSGLEACVNRSYDLILLDLLLPDMDGIEVLKLLREKNNASTVVMLTGHGGIRSSIAAVQLGADGYMEKMNMTSTASDHTEFFFAIQQAMVRRVGIVTRTRLEEMKVDFYSMVTHDLRNPAGSISALAEMLAEDEPENFSEDQKELVDAIRKESDRLVKLINDYLDFASIDAGYLDLSFADFDLRHVVEESAKPALLKSRARGQTCTLVLPREPVPVFADEERLRQVVDNLYSNAIKYTPEGGVLTAALAIEGSEAVFTLQDTGIGITADQQSCLFTKYNRLINKNTRRIPGTGLGLLIVKEIVEGHKGRIRVESEGVPGKGTTFKVYLPLRTD